MSDPLVELRPRAVDQNWFYQKAIPNPVTGFAPFRSEVYFASESRFASWLSSPYSSARDFNINDELMREALFAVHDYLHVWAYRAIQTLVPNLGFGQSPIQKDNLETFVFCHLLTEAVAVVGLDYWYLSCTDLNEKISIGTNFRGLTVDYHESDLPEYQRFQPSFSTQNQKFFVSLVEFYCSGEFSGFNLDDLKRSPKLLKWLKHELVYGAKQREYARAWFSFLSDDRNLEDAESSSAPVICSRKWQRELAKNIGQMLWEKVKEEKIHSLCSKPKTIWKTPTNKAPDFRFVNLNAIRDIASLKIQGGKNDFEFLAYQWLAKHDFNSLDCELMELLPELLAKRDFSLLRSVFKNLKEIEKVGNESKEIFVLP